MGKYADYQVLSGAKANRVRILDKLADIKPSTNELKEGEIYFCGKYRYRITIAPHRGSCKGCDFLQDGVCNKSGSSPCIAYNRTDKTWMIFKKIGK